MHTCPICSKDPDRVAAAEEFAAEYPGLGCEHHCLYQDIDEDSTQCQSHEGLEKMTSALDRLVYQTERSDIDPLEAAKLLPKHLRALLTRRIKYLAKKRAKVNDDRLVTDSIESLVNEALWDEKFPADLGGQSLFLALFRDTGHTVYHEEYEVWDSMVASESWSYKYVESLESTFKSMSELIQPCCAYLDGSVQ